jgi:deoxyribonuclease-4
MDKIKYGAHLSGRTILDDVKATGAEAAQIFLGSPKTWRAPAAKSEKDKKFWAEYELPIFVHSSYIINPASDNEGVRDNSTKSLGYQFNSASEVSASGVVIHAGQAPQATLEVAAKRWYEALTAVDTHGVQILIENTAGGNVAPGRSLEGLEILWNAIGSFAPKLCLDTCHAWAGNVLDQSLPADEAFSKLLDELESRGIEIGLTHLNGSLDDRGSGRDHHSNLTSSNFDLSVAKQVAERAGVPAILETPGPLETLRDELELLRKS